ncbi:UTRA domain-containing protein [Nocardia vinacea]|uniref:UTRA domain-containing protein n=1 Tax=Nocardia vinacea TaxID=96468 RepID=UPI00341EFB69
MTTSTPVRRVARNRLTRGDQRGFYADLVASHSTPEVRTEIDPQRPVPARVAEHLGVQPNTPVLARARHMAADGAPLQLATSYFAPSIVAELPILGEQNTGPGGMYQRFEDAGHTLEQVDIVGGRSATPNEVAELNLEEGAFVLTITRITRDAATNAVLEVGDLVLAPGRQELVYNI